MSVQWNPSKFIQEVTKNGQKYLTKIAVDGVNYARDNMPRVPDAASEPGDFPYAKTTWLKRNLTYAFEGLKVAFGIYPLEKKGKPVVYARPLETGTPKMLPRPWLTLMMNYLEEKYGLKFERHI